MNFSKKLPSGKFPIAPFGTMGKIQIGKDSGQGPERPATLNEVRDFVKNQKKVFGQVLVTAAGVQKEFPLIFPTAGAFLLGVGFSIDPSNPAVGVPLGTCNLLVNGDQIISGLPCPFLNVSFRDFEYFEYPRPLAGVDKVVLQITDTASRNVFFSVYYI